MQIFSRPVQSEKDDETYLNIVAVNGFLVLGEKNLKTKKETPISHDLYA
jgi:hypothetical protein